MVWSMGDIDEENADRSYSFGPACDAKFFKDNSCRMVAPDDANAVQVIVYSTQIKRCVNLTG